MSNVVTVVRLTRPLGRILSAWALGGDVTLLPAFAAYNVTCSAELICVTLYFAVGAETVRRCAPAHVLLRILKEWFLLRILREWFLGLFVGLTLYCVGLGYLHVWASFCCVFEGRGCFDAEFEGDVFFGQEFVTEGFVGHCICQKGGH